MIKYEIRNGSTIIQFATLQEAQTYNPNIEIFEVEENVSTVNDLSHYYYKAKEFGGYLKDVFLIDNWNLATTITPQISTSLAQKFSSIISLCLLGDIKTIKYLLPYIEIDTIFTQERKDKYIEMVNDFVANNYPTLN